MCACSITGFQRAQRRDRQVAGCLFMGTSLESAGRSVASDERRDRRWKIACAFWPA